MDADAIVIGAGAAGLAASRRLAEKSLRVILLEARDRVGGRAWSRPAARTATPAELGAEFIHGRASQTMALLRDAGMSAIPTGGDSWTLGEDGQLRRAENDFTTAPNIFNVALSLRDDESVDRFLQRFEGDAAMRQTAMAARAFVEGFEAADPAIASVTAIAQEWQSGVDSTSARPRGGYGPMFERLRNLCVGAGVEIVQSCVARRLAWRRGAVTVDARDAGGELRTLRARAAILTLSVGILRDGGEESEFVFDPNLPATKRAALAGIEMGHVVKVALWFRTAFWERAAGGAYRDAAFFRSEAGPFPAYWTQFPVRSSLIVAWAGGPKALALSGVSQREIIERARDGFAALLGEPELVRKEFEGGVMHDWNHDPFARGAYSYLAVGAGNARAILAKPVNATLFFAGEATSTDGQGGTVNGALESGERAATQAAASLGVRDRG
jgi:monoamine oxidase